MLAAMCVAAAPAPALEPQSGKIVLDFTCAGQYEVYVMDADGSHRRRLTSVASQGAWAAHPAWSPDGSQIAFNMIWPAGNHRSEVYLMDAAGGKLRPLTTTPGSKSSWNATWSPDGRNLAFASDRQGNHDIYIVDHAGGGLRQLTHTTGVGRYSWNPAWSPDGRQIAFDSNREGQQDIYVADAATSRIRRLTTTPAGRESWTPAWSPDGRRIAVASNRDGGDEIYLMDSDGSKVTRVRVGAVGRPRWSPDGSKVIVQRVAEEGREAVWIFNMDGSGLTRLTHDDCSARHPDWCCLNAPSVGRRRR